MSENIPAIKSSFADPAKRNAIKYKLIGLVVLAAAAVFAGRVTAVSDARKDAIKLDLFDCAVTEARQNPDLDVSEIRDRCLAQIMPAEVDSSNP